MRRNPIVQIRRRAWLLLAVLCAVLPPRAHAHPMGNFSINHYAGIHIGRDTIEIRYIIDIAEIPTYQQIQEAGIVAEAGDPSLLPYLNRQAAAWNENLHVSVNEEPVRLTPVSHTVIFPPGAGGLPTMKIGVLYRGAIHVKSPDTPLHLRYSDDNFAGHAGWKEIVVTAGPGVTLAANPYQTDRSAQLTDYPTSLLNSPPQNLEADVVWSAAPLLTASGSQPARGGAVSAAPAQPQARADRAVGAKSLPVSPPGAAPAAAGPVSGVSPAATALAAPELVLAPNRQATPRNRFTELMTTRKLSAWFLLTAAFFAAGLGALHALEPGHGKTIVAAYLVGSRGRTRHAFGLGLLVTASHTAGVYLLGAVVLYASKYIIPEQIYPWLSIFSGLIIAVLAAYLMLRAWNGLEAEEPHSQETLHTHWYSRPRKVVANDLSAESPAASVAVELPKTSETVPLRQLVLLGITGGIIPCPAALVVLLAAASLHRIVFGLYLIVAFSAGLAAVLIGIGILMVRTRGLLSRWKSDAPWMQRWLPLASASAMMLAGLGIAAAALPATGLSFHPNFSREHIAPFAAIVGLGLVLGMRHSTDPDHVVAVSTIVSRERSVRQGALIGMLWGLGHTLTIFMVGAAIILFKLTIPPRLGLSMEMAVAAMLILLGILNLTGLLKRLTARFTPGAWNGGAAQTAVDFEAEASSQANLPRRLLSRFGFYNLIRPLAIGLVHGLAGSAAVALLVLSMIRSPAWACAYLIVFGLGTVAGMMLMTTAIAIPIALTSGRFTRYLTVASGVASISFGLFLVYHLGFVDGLFTSHVHWTPE